MELKVSTVIQGHQCPLPRPCSVVTARSARPSGRYERSVTNSRVCIVCGVKQEGQQTPSSGFLREDVCTNDTQGSTQPTNK